MKVFWLSHTDLKGISFYREEPFENWAWWDAMREPWGAIAFEENGALRAAWLLAERRLAGLRLWRMPLAVPYAPLLMLDPLSRVPYATQSPILRALAGFLRKAEWHLQFIAGALPPEWSYLPPFRQMGFRPEVAGSFVIHHFEPSSALRRKLRQTESLPVWPMEASRALSFWQTHAPPAISAKFRQQLEALVHSPFPWEILATGDPPQAVGFFLWGKKRVWYYASAHRPDSHSQAGTRLLATAIQKALHDGKIFDFMGSLLPGVERFFWQFEGLWEHRFFLITPLLKRLSS